MLVVIEEPAFSAPGKENNGVLRIDEPSRLALVQYQAGLNNSIRKDLIRVMGDNRISTHLIFAPPVATPNPQSLRLPPEMQAKWTHTLWIRHTKGMANCRYGACTAFFQTEARLFDTASGHLLWHAKDDKASYYGYKVWEDGRMYKFLLERLNADGMISLPDTSPIVRIENPDGIK